MVSLFFVDVVYGTTERIEKFFFFEQGDQRDICSS